MSEARSALDAEEWDGAATEDAGPSKIGSIESMLPELALPAIRPTAGTSRNYRHTLAG